MANQALKNLGHSIIIIRIEIKSIL